MITNIHYVFIGLEDGITDKDFEAGNTYNLYGDELPLMAGIDHSLINKEYIYVYKTPKDLKQYLSTYNLIRN